MDRDTARILAGDGSTWEVWIRRAGAADFHHTKTFNDRKEARQWCDSSGLQMDE